MRPIIDFLDKHTWLKKKWGDLVTLNYGKRLTDYQQGTGPVPVYGTNGPIGYTHKALYDKPTIIVGRKGAYRGVYYSERPCFVIDTAFYVTPLLEIDLKWAYYALLSCDINTLDSGSAIPSTSRDAFYNLDVYLPPLETQKEIAHILGTLDDKIELNRKMCKTLEEIAQTLFKHWFIDFEFPNEQGKPYKSSGGDMVDSELGPIPKGWRISPVAEIADKVGIGPFGSSIKVETFVDYGMPVISGQHLNEARLTDCDYNYISFDHASKLKNALVHRGDIIMTHAGNIGQVSLIPDESEFETYIISQRQFYLRCNRHLVLPSYLVSCQA